MTSDPLLIGDPGIIDGADDPDLIQSGGISEKGNPIWYIDEDADDDIHYVRTAGGKWFALDPGSPSWAIISLVTESHVFGLRPQNPPTSTNGLVTRANRIPASWSDVQTDVTVQGRVKQLSSGRLFVLTTTGKCYYSDDNGENWTGPVTIGSRQQNGIVLQLSSGRLLCFGGADGSSLWDSYRSDDEGATWTTASISTATLSHTDIMAAFYDGTTITVIDSESNRFTSADGISWNNNGAVTGQSWTWPRHSVSPSYGVVLSSGRMVWFEAVNHRIWVSDDSGASWTEKTGSGSPKGMVVLNDTIYRIKDSSNIIERSTDGANTWTDEDTVDTITGAIALDLAIEGQRFQ